MPYLRRLVLLLTLSTSILLVTIHLLHFSRPHHASEPLHPVLSKEEAEKSFDYLKKYDHPPRPAINIPTPEYADKLAHGNEKPAPPKKEDVVAPPNNDRDELARKLYGKLPASKIPPPNSTAWHQDKNMWKVKDALQAGG